MANYKISDDLEYNTWRTLYLREKYISIYYEHEYVYVRDGGDALLTYNRADGSVKIFKEEIEFSVLKGIIESI